MNSNLENETNDWIMEWNQYHTSNQIKLKGTRHEFIFQLLSSIVTLSLFFPIKDTLLYTLGGQLMKEWMNCKEELNDGMKSNVKECIQRILDEFQNELQFHLKEQQQYTELKYQTMGMFHINKELSIGLESFESHFDQRINMMNAFDTFLQELKNQGIQIHELQLFNSNDVKSIFKVIFISKCIK